jgi:heme-degrading monooxygenase HmoA
MQSVKSESQAIKEQADFIAWERSNTERNNWARIESVADDPFQRGAAISRMYVRPGQTEEARSAAAQERGLAAIQAGKSITNNTTININGGDTAEVRRTVEDVNRRNNQFDSRMLQQVYN